MGEDFAESRKLTAANETDEHTLIRTRIRALCGNHCYASVQLFYDLFGKSLGGSRNYFEFQGRLETVYYEIVRACRGEHFGESQKHGRKSLPEHEERNEYDNGVEREYEPTDACGAEMLVDVCSDYIRAAAAAADFEKDPAPPTMSPATAARMELSA